MHHTPTRRTFLGYIGATILTLVATPLRAQVGHAVVQGKHPEPRPGIDASKVLTADQLQNPAAASVYDMVREIPQIADGIRCTCGCADLPGYYSLLTCYEEGGMAQWCNICQGQARRAYRLHKDGKTLDEIRASIDARYGTASPPRGGTASGMDHMQR
jgi:hypothetical protein